MYKIGDCVFAQIRGHQTLPAVIEEIEIRGKVTFVNVTLFGQKKSRDKCTLTKLSSFEENKGKLFISGKLMENKEFVQSIKEAQSELRKTNSRKNNN